MFCGKKKLEFSYKPEESQKESYAYNLRIILRNPRIEYGQSVFSCSIDNYTVPNRDYSYEGLCALINNENWKFLDGIAIKLENFKLIPQCVRATPWYASYEYKFENCLLKAKYELLETGLKVSFATTKKLPKISIAPLVDIRHMHEKSDFASHKIKFNNNYLTITKDSKKCYIAGNLKFENIDINGQEWVYKLGSGFRKKIDDNIVFQDERRVIMKIEGITLIPKTERSAELFVLCNTEKVKRSKQIELIRLNFLSKYFKFFGSRYGVFYELALLARAYCLLNNFGIFVNNICLPDAGFGWFRQLWLRDCFEGLYNNFGIYYNYNRKYIEKALRLAFRYQDSESGLIPTFIKGKPVYNSLDTSFLCFLTGFKYLDYCKEPKTKAELISRASILAQNIGKVYKLSDEELLLTPCDISWVDSKVGNTPTRLPEHWAVDEYYYLVEVNALWLRFLSELEKVSDNVFASADRKSAFKRVFFYNDILCDIVSEDMRRNEIENSLSVVALALLPDLFSNNELERIFNSLKKSFVYRNGKLFGLVVRNIGEVYLNDEQYHKRVFWPRDLPYFIKFLLSLKKLELVEQILINVLEHQMYEGAVFYTQELFSPSYTMAVPVKNPAQYWSQFVEPFLWFYNTVKSDKHAAI
ncbi:MAG: amylo-alpha-1,6-glucosidase [Candidatus Thermoplasmatota archaeon]|nr:amylo-alpha-1,6-glucosidase [Candidatus Thermoplasmatota archaeon]